jgi:sodium pump decarboxylase gamma subunit
MTSTPAPVRKLPTVKSEMARLYFTFGIIVLKYTWRIIRIERVVWWQQFDAQNSAWHRLHALSVNCEEIMIVEGVKLAIIGILIVYTFLSLLIFLMYLSAALLRRYTQQEEREQAAYKKRSSTKTLLKDSRLVAAISAAIAAHRKSVRR